MACPQCGSAFHQACPVSSARSAPYRTSALQASTCVGCGCTLEAGGLRCEACERTLRAEVLPLLCPRCHKRLETGAPELGAPMTCPLCAGCFIDAPQLRLLEANAQQVGVVPESPSPASMLSASTPPDIAYAPCPKCSKHMNRVNYGPMSGLVVDVCKVHGIWFERGELERGLAFVAAGGERAWPAESRRAEPTPSVVEHVAKGLSTPVQRRTDAPSLLVELLELVFGL